MQENYTSLDDHVGASVSVPRRLMGIERICVCGSTNQCLEGSDLVHTNGDELFVCMLATGNSKAVIQDIWSLTLVQGKTRVARIEQSVNDRLTWVLYDGPFCSIRTRLDHVFFQKSLGGRRFHTVTAQGVAILAPDHVPVAFAVDVPLQTRKLLPPFRGKNRAGYFFVTALVLTVLLCLFLCGRLVLNKRSRLQRLYTRLNKRRKAANKAKKATRIEEAKTYDDEECGEPSQVP